MSSLFDVIKHNVTIVFITLFCFLYCYFKHKYSYWSKLKVPHEPGKFPFGSISSVVLRKQTFIDRIDEIYRNFKKKGCKYVGLYFSTKKALLIIDPELVRKVLSTDFHHFPGRGIYYDEKNEPLSAHLVALNGDKWRELRQKLSPTFSPGKLKSMFSLVLKCGKLLTQVLLECEKENAAIEMKDLAARYTTDVIGSCAFGIECNSLTNPAAEFRMVGKKFFHSNIFDRINRLVIRNAPWLARLLKIRVFKRETSEFFINVVRESISYRRQNNISRKDFLQMLMELTDKGNENNEILKESVKFVESPPLTEAQIAAHAFVFFIAGFESSASTITLALYELSKLTHIQQRLRKEIFQVLKKHDGNITYDAIMEMQYMDQVLLETLRKYPTFVILMRKCTGDYNLPDDITLEKGIPVIIPVHALHHDPEYFPEPEQFDPERFNSDLSQLRGDTYLPFGSGPRICIGLRFAMIEMKVAITALLWNFKFTLNEKTSNPLVMNPFSVFLTPLHGTWLNISPLTKEEKDGLI